MFRSFRTFVCISVLNVHSLKPTATLYSSNGCRACLNFEKKFNTLKTEYSGIMFEKINISESDVTRKIAYENKINKIPLIIFKVEDDEVNRLTGVRSKYTEIEDTCKEISGFTAKIPKFDPIILETAKLCEKVYDDKFLKRSEHVENRDSDCQATITKSGTKVFVAFRGSDSVQDWRSNFRSLLVSYPAKSENKVHAGFLIQWISVKDDLLGKLGKIIKEDRLIEDVFFCGHSAGIVCCLAALDFEKQNKSKLNIEVVTFGAPRMGNKAFKDNIESKMKCTRIVLDRDIVTRLPFKFLGYRHIGEPYQLRENSIINRETSAIESLWWMFLGIGKADIGIKDHFIDNYVEAIEKNLT